MRDWKSNLLLTALILLALYLNRQAIAVWLGSDSFTEPGITEQAGVNPGQPISTDSGAGHRAGELDANHTEHTACGAPTQYRCNSAALGKVKIQSAAGIYTWQDDKGITHFGDRPPQQGATEYQFKSNQALDYFELELDSGALSHDFRNRLEARLNAVFRTYAGIIGLEAMRKVKLRIVIANNRRAYSKMLDVLGSSAAGNQGIYKAAHNIAMVEYRNEAQAMRTAIHEAVHAINQAVIGNTPRWFNEGTAEYFEYIETSMNLSQLKPNGAWVRNSYLVGSLVHPHGLFEAAGSWRGKAQSLMYRSSWVFMYYLMSSQRGRSQLKHYMRLEQENPCDLLGFGPVQSIFETREEQFANSYAQVTRQKLTGHRF
ncbi:DUF4124 domain-containing protein [Pseudoalteromonas sp. OOF1S-7]|uniref:DUF4124 domain-containing protein n=1 Tax=Pseudoalteromonas sp. OOF1S-7 TaxID=2917757 RepID=UPI001EF3E8C7|nr:DUF4124 domain-containing protein [Pseudoalteromonas sp. OOF1S-7]MCG7534104.1 DUF4124 domain-containing protein [Pseudoalteromonas sp. OOF1S-7]